MGKSRVKSYILSGPLIKSHVCDGARGLTARVWTPRAAVMAAVPQRAPPYICQIQISRVSRAHGHAPITANKENWNGKVLEPTNIYCFGRNT